MENNFQVNAGEPKSIRTKFFNPAEFLGKGWAVWRGPAGGDGLTGKEDMDQRSLAIKEVDFSQILFETCFKEGENLITGEEKLSRLKQTDHILLGGNAFLGLWEDYQANKENSILEWLFRNRKITYLDFFEILRGPSGRRYVLCLYRHVDGWWHWCYGWLDDDWDAGRRSAVLASQS